MNADTFYGVLAGGAITLIVSLVCFILAGKQLRDESKRLRHKTDLVLKGLEEAKIMKVNRDSTGDIIGIVYERTFKGGLTPTGELTKEVHLADSSK